MSQVTDTSHMFYRAKAFNQPLDSWDMSQVTNTSHMFDKHYSYYQK